MLIPSQCYSDVYARKSEILKVNALKEETVCRDEIQEEPKLK